MKGLKIKELTNFFKVLSDNTRLRIMHLLVKSKMGICVCEIMDALLENQYNVSRHLKVLKSVGLIQENKIGRWVYYSIANPKNQFQKFCIKVISNLPEDPFSGDAQRLNKRLSLRRNGKCVIGVNSREWGKILTRRLNKRR